MIRFSFLLSLLIFIPFIGFSETRTFSQLDPLSIQIDSLKNPNCVSPLGFIKVSALGGFPGYTYSWNTGASGPILSNIPAGDYTVEVTDDSGSSATLKITIVDDFTAPLSDAGTPVVAPCTNSILSLSGGGSSGPEFTYQWAASNGGHIVSGAQTLSPVINQAGTYALTVLNTDNGCTGTDATTVSGQNAPPNALASGGVLNCSTSSVTLSAVFTELHTQYVWQGPGGFSSNLKNPVVSVTGNYVFTLTDTLTGCIQKSTANVSSNYTTPNADASGTGILTCTQTSVILSGASSTPGVVYSWTGPNGFSSQDQNPTVSNAGVYTLTVLNPVNGCTATDAVTVTSNLTAPIASASPNGMLNCNFPSIQIIGMSNTPGVMYEWIGPNNFNSNAQNPFVTNPGIYTLTVKNPVNGCTGTATATVLQNIAPPNVTASGGTKTCSSPTVTLTSSSSTPGVTYSWSGPNGFISSLQNPSVSVVGTYTVKVTNPVNGCTASTIATVSQNTTPPSVWASSGTITCTNPQAKITTNSIPQGLSYSWSGPNNFSSSAQNPMVGVAGYYYVTATNPSNGCTNTGSVYTNADITPPFAYAGEDKSLNCYFTTILINASFSSNGPNYTYLWTTTDGHIVSGANSLYPRVDTVGTYTLKVTNTQNGCKDLDSMEVTQSLPVSAVISQTTPVYCTGGSDGTAKVSAGGGSSSYNYQWSNGATTALNSGLIAGTYTVTVQDSEGCSATASASINQLILSAIVNVTHQTIPGVNNGTASIVGNGGTAPYTAKWSNGATALAISNLAPGPYAVTLTDSHGCTIVKTTNINPANCILSGSITGVNVSCFGLTNGSATFNLNGAANPVGYLWSNSGTTKTITGIGAGTYTVTATDAAGCQLVQMVQITAPTLLIANISSLTNVHCPQSSDGSISVGVNGGTQPYNYNWSNNSTNASISNLPPGGYQLTVTDAHQCSSTISAQINGPTPITITVLDKADVDCPSSSTGSISVSVQGGLPPYHYFWSNGSTLSAISGLTPGNYTLTITDANDCPKSLSAQILVVDHTPPVLKIKNATVDLDNNGTVSISPSLLDNGSYDDCGIASWTVTPNQFDCSQIGPNVVTITATDLSGNTSTAMEFVTVVDNFVPILTCPPNIITGSCNAEIQFNAPQISDNCATNPALLLQVSGLPGGSTFPVGMTHQAFRYADASGNTGFCSFDISIEDAPDFTGIAIPSNCGTACDGAITLTQISGGDASIIWSNGQTGFNPNGLCVGAYTATITDAFNCTQTLSFQIDNQDTQAPVLNCPANISKGYCNNNVVYSQPQVIDNCAVDLSHLQLTAGLPSGAQFPIGATLQTFTYNDGSGNIASCSFTVTITGSPGIQVSTQMPTCNNYCNGSASINLSGGSPPFSIQWSNGQTGTQASNLCAGNYNYTVSDNNGCIKTGATAISQPTAIQVVTEQVHNDPGNMGAGSIQISINGGAAPYSILWTRNGQPFSSTQNLNFLYPGQYVAVVTDANGCTGSSGAITIINAVSTIDPAWAPSLEIFPNPASETIQIDFGAPFTEAFEVNMLNINGQLIQTNAFEKHFQTVILEISGLPEGLYLLQLKLESGNTVIKKMVVAR